MAIAIADMIYDISSYFLDETTATLGLKRVRDKVVGNLRLIVTIGISF